MTAGKRDTEKGETEDGGGVHTPLSHTREEMRGGASENTRVLGRITPRAQAIGVPGLPVGFSGAGAPGDGLQKRAKYRGNGRGKRNPVVVSVVHIMQL